MFVSVCAFFSLSLHTPFYFATSQSILFFKIHLWEIIALRCTKGCNTVEARILPDLSDFKFSLHLPVVHLPNAVSHPCPRATTIMSDLTDGIYGITDCESERRNNPALLNDNHREDIRGVFSTGNGITQI